MGRKRQICGIWGRGERLRNILEIKSGFGDCP